MVIEIATLPVKPDAEAAFVEGFEAGTAILARQPGCRKLTWGRRVEPELAYVLTAEWDDIQDHFNFRETQDYKDFGALFRAHLADAPRVVHFEPRG